jgi:hypothetical protein
MQPVELLILVAIEVVVMQHALGQVPHHLEQLAASDMLQMRQRRL